MAHSLDHPSRLSLPEIEAAWLWKDDPPLPECTYDPELHTGPSHMIETSDERAAREAVAREVCTSCPALQFCYLYALRVRPTSGIWAGRTASEIDTAAQIVKLYEDMRRRAAELANAGAA
jgi:hypothetical protein